MRIPLVAGNWKMHGNRASNRALLDAVVGGIALGLDRLVVLFNGGDSIRDSIAFPKTASATSLMDGAPTGVDPADLKELKIRIVAE